MPNPTTRILALCGLIFAAVSVSAFAAEPLAMRPPAVPLVVHDPYFSIWSFGDKLAESWPRHWTGACAALCSMVRIDGKTYRIMGLEPKETPAMKQLSVTVLPTCTIYQFTAAGVDLTLTFLTPILPHDLDLVARPVTYVRWSVRSVNDAEAHKVSLYYDNSAELVSTTRNSKSFGRGRRWRGSNVMRIGSKDQPVLQKAGDDLQIDWGYLYMAARKSDKPSMCIAGHEEARETFAKERQTPGKRRHADAASGQ